MDIPGDRLRRSGEGKGEFPNRIRFHARTLDENFLTQFRQSTNDSNAKVPSPLAAVCSARKGVWPFRDPIRLSKPSPRFIWQSLGSWRPISTATACERARETDCGLPIPDHIAVRKQTANLLSAVVVLSPPSKGRVYPSHRWSHLCLSIFGASNILCFR